MKTLRMFLAAVLLAAATVCNAPDPTGPDLGSIQGPLYEEGTNHGSGG